MRLSVLAATTFLTLAAAAETPSDPAAEREKRLQIEQRAYELYPRRRDTPMRELNITDGEVREIQRLMRGVQNAEILNISAVVTGCPCEEGGECTEQVYIVGKSSRGNFGLQLSRLRNRWALGRVQRWWLDYAALRARESRMERTEYEKQRGILLLDFPMCSSPGTKGVAVATVQPSSVKP